MARRKPNEVPAYLFHKARNKAYVNLNGKVIYLPGKFNSPESKTEYDRLIVIWTLNGRHLSGMAPGTPAVHLLPAPTIMAPPISIPNLPPATPAPSPAIVGVVVAELAEAYLGHCETYYIKDGQPTTQVRIVQDALKVLLPLFGTLAVTEFGPLKLGIVCDAMIAKGWCRTTVVKHLSVVKSMFKWGTAKEMVPGSVYHALQAFSGPKKGRSKARENPEIVGVADEMVETTLPCLPLIVADMVRVQRLTGMRPGEVCLLREADMKKIGAVWKYEPLTHKNAHHGLKRVIAVGPKARAIIEKYQKADPTKFVFCPQDSEADRLAKRYAARTTPLSCGNKPGEGKVGEHDREPGDRYTEASYRRAVHRACEKAFAYPTHLAPKVITPTGRKKQPRPETPGEWWARLSEKERAEVKAYRKAHRWAPNQLRHAAADAICEAFAFDASQVVLGHAKPNTTALYVSNTFKRAAAIMAQVG